jgi:hypothetical protein
MPDWNKHIPSIAIQPTATLRDDLPAGMAPLLAAFTALYFLTCQSTVNIDPLHPL